MSLKDAKQKFSELQEEIVNDSYWKHEEEVDNMLELLKEHPDLCSDALKMIEEYSDDMNGTDKGVLLNNIIEIEPELGSDIIRRLDEFDIDMNKGLDFIEKVAKGNPDNKEILRKCLLLLKMYDSDKKAKSITNEILTMQPELKEFSESLTALNF